MGLLDCFKVGDDAINMEVNEGLLAFEDDGVKEGGEAALDYAY